MAEMAGKGGQLRGQDRVVAPGAAAMRVAATEHGDTAGRAQWHLAVGRGEMGALRDEPIEGRGVARRSAVGRTAGRQKTVGVLVGKKEQEVRAGGQRRPWTGQRESDYGNMIRYKSFRQNDKDGRGPGQASGRMSMAVESRVRRRSMRTSTNTSAAATRCFSLLPLISLPADYMLCSPPSARLARP